MTTTNGSVLPVIGLDVDEVLVQGLTARFLEYLLRKRHPVNQAVFRKTNNWEQATGYTQEHMSALYIGFFNDPTTPPPLPVPGAAEGVERLATVAVPIAITARDKKLRRQTMQDLRAVHQRRVRSGCFGAFGNKHHVIARRQVVIHVDDSRHEIDMIARHAPTTWLIGFPSSTAWEPLPRRERIIPLADYGAPLGELSGEEREAVQRRSWQEVSDLVRNILELHHQPVPV